MLTKITAFTLVELLVTVLVLCIILVIAMPAMTNLFMNNRLTVHTTLFVSALNYARNKALNESINVSVCPFSTPQSASCGTNWKNGWIVVSQSSSGSTLLQSQQYLSSDTTLLSNVSTVTFTPHGLTNTQSNFTLCDTRGASFARSVEILATGFVQSSQIAGQAVWDNSALVCP